MLTSNRIINMHIELGKYIPVSGKSQDFCQKKACSHKSGLWKYCLGSKFFDSSPLQMNLSAWSPHNHICDPVPVLLCYTGANF